MATLTISITAGATTSQTLTFSGTDATRIMNAYKAVVDPNADQGVLTAALAQQAKNYFVAIVNRAETVTPTPPSIT